MSRSSAAFPQPSPRGRGEFVPFVHAARGLACLLVVYCHLVGGQLRRNSAAWFPHDWLTQHVLTPFRVTRDFGFFGVALFFVISGFVIAHVAERETRGAFALKRVLRIYPPLLVAIALCWALSAIHAAAGLPAFPGAVPAEPTWQALALDASLLAGVVSSGRPTVLAVTWTLTVELCFYLHALLLLPLLRARGVHTALALAAWGAAGAGALAALGARPGLRAAALPLAQLLHYLPLFCIGVLAHARHRARISARGLILSVLGCLLSYSVAAALARPPSLDPERLFPVQAAYAASVFFLLMLAAPPTLGRASRWLGDVSYSLYLLHTPVGLVAGRFLLPHIGVGCALLGSIAVALLSAHLMHRAVERPAQEFARQLLGKRQLAQRARGSPLASPVLRKPDTLRSTPDQSLHS